MVEKNKNKKICGGNKQRRQSKKIFMLKFTYQMLLASPKENPLKETPSRIDRNNNILTNSLLFYQIDLRVIFLHTLLLPL